MIEQPFENWLPIPEYEDLYEIDTYGNVRSFDKKVKNNNGYRIIKGKILKPKLNNKGYYRIGLTKDKKQKFYFIHRLVALTYLPNPNDYKIINHKDGNPKNNYIENLEWCTQQYNIQHAYNTGLKMGVSAEHKGKNNPNVKLNEQDVLNIRNDKNNRINIKDSYKKYKEKITFKGFQNVWFGYIWKNLVEKVEE